MAEIDKKVELPPMEYTVRPYQKEEVDKMTKILLKHGFVCNKSEMGTGKTYVVGYLARSLSLPVFVVGPVATISKWNSVCKMAKVDVICNISYQSLRGLRGYNLKHKYLTREDNDHLIYKPTQELLDVVESGILVVFDEFDALKNITIQRKAAFTLIHTVLNSKSKKSKVVFLSATPWDDPKGKQFCNFMNLVGILDNNINTDIEKTQLINWCNKVDNKTTNTIINKTNGLNQVFYDLFVKVVLPNISTTMPCLKLDVEKDVKNGFFTILDQQGQLDLSDGVEELGRIAGMVVVNNVNTMLANVYMKIELAKVKTLIRLGEQKLKDEPNCKIIYCVYYKETQYRIFNHITEHWGDQCCDILNGDTKIKERDKMIESFQTDPKFRVIIINQRVGGKGIDLHDTKGDSPRYLFGIPRHEILEQHQVTGRLYRDGTQSKATILWVYGKHVSEEEKILDSLSRKCKVLQDTLEIQFASGIKYPGNYESYYEPDQISD